MKELIDVFKMESITPQTRARIIIELGRALNYTYGRNITESLVYELVKALDPSNPIIRSEYYLKHVRQP